MAQVHMTEAELARNLHAALETVRNGAEILVEHNHHPFAIIKTVEGPGYRGVHCHRESIRRAAGLCTVTRSGFRRGCAGSHRLASRAIGSARLGLILDSSV